MKILTLGSLNFDYIYSAEHIVAEGETISASELDLKHGGKGLNQSVALGRAGADVAMAGCVGHDGDALIEILSAAGVDTRNIKELDGRSGHAIIQLASNGANAIVIYGGANHRVTHDIIDDVLKNFSAGDYLLLQNEISNVGYAIQAAKKRGMKVVLNPSPVSSQLWEYPLELVDIFILNELEGQVLSQMDSGAENDAILRKLAERFPTATIVLTLGEKGAIYHDAECDLHCTAHRVPVVDTTGAGDTFCGYFLACTMKGMAPAQALEMASKASAIAIGKKGAAVSIPTFGEVIEAKLDSK